MYWSPCTNAAEVQFSERKSHQWNCKKIKCLKHELCLLESFTLINPAMLSFNILCNFLPINDAAYTYNVHVYSTKSNLT